MSTARWVLTAVGFALWGIGVHRIAEGSWGFGGALVVVGGLCLVIAASGGWSAFWEGLTNWLYFWR